MINNKILKVMKKVHSLYEFCGRTIVDHIEEHLDLLKNLFNAAEARNLDLRSAREADKEAMREIDSYVLEHFDFVSDVLYIVKDIFYDIYGVFVSGYTSMELHCQNLDESDMDSTLCGIVRDYFNF